MNATKVARSLRIRVSLIRAALANYLKTGQLPPPATRNHFRRLQWRLSTMPNRDAASFG